MIHFILEDSPFGCFIAIVGPNGVVDAIFGTLATFISVYAISLTEKFIKNNNVSLIISSLWPTIFNGVIIGWMLIFLSITIGNINRRSRNWRICCGYNGWSASYKIDAKK